MGVGSPLVASDAGGIPELITHERNGLLFAPANATELASAIIRLLKDPDLAVRLAAQARRDCDALFEIGSIARQTAEFYSKVISGECS
jgi:glycosyltransferase involved in cell wall biosynthesis